MPEEAQMQTCADVGFTYEYERYLNGGTLTERHPQRRSPKEKDIKQINYIISFSLKLKFKKKSRDYTYACGQDGQFQPTGP